MSNGPSNQLNHPLNFQPVEVGKDPLALGNVPGSPKQSSPKQSSLDKFFSPPTFSRSRSITEYRESSVSVSKSCEKSENREIQQQGNKLRKIKSSVVKFFKHPVVKGVGTFLAGLLLTAGATVAIIATGGLAALVIGVGVAGVVISGAAGGKVYSKSKSAEKAKSFDEIQMKAERIVDDVEEKTPKLRLIAEKSPSLRKQLKELVIRLDTDWGALELSKKYGRDPIQGEKILKCMETTHQSLLELVEQHGDNLPLFPRKGTEDPQSHPEIEMVELPPNKRAPRNHSISKSENENSMSGESMFGLFGPDEEDSLAGGVAPEKSDKDIEIGDREESFSGSDVFGDPNEVKKGKSKPDFRDIVPPPQNDEDDEEIDNIFLDVRGNREKVTPGEGEELTPGFIDEVGGEESVIDQRRDTNLEEVTPLAPDFELSMVEQDIEMSVNPNLPPGFGNVQKVQPRDMDSDLQFAIRLLTGAGVTEEAAIQIITSNKINSKLIDQLIESQNNQQRVVNIATEMIKQFNSE